MRIGAQVSVAGGVTKAFDRAVELGADSMQIFALSPRQWKSAAPPDEVLEAFRQIAADHSTVKGTYCHASYLINLATGNDALKEKSFECLVGHLAVATGLGAEGVVLHIGSHLGAGIDAVMDRIAEALVGALDAATLRVGEPSAKILIENTAGAGGTVGRSFEELAAIIDATGNDERIGVCMDTQHLFASGVSYETPAKADAVIREIKGTVGLERLSCLHLNDSKVAFGTNRDRHENLGEGEIGANALSYLLSHPDIQHVPALLEVPGDGAGPRESDVAVAKKILAKGLRQRAKS
ncbi:MAG TPA: deoxyribonuclease IV [Acidimicrobiales bacterium]|nr:deoxyribonuclease IV [Acidimicrobiales bacterium]